MLLSTYALDGALETSWTRTYILHPETFRPEPWANGRLWSLLTTWDDERLHDFPEIFGIRLVPVLSGELAYETDVNMEQNDGLQRKLDKYHWRYWIHAMQRTVFSHFRIRVIGHERVCLEPRKTDLTLRYSDRVQWTSRKRGWETVMPGTLKMVKISVSWTKYNIEWQEETHFVAAGTLSPKYRYPTHLPSPLTPDAVGTN